MGKTTVAASIAALAAARGQHTLICEMDAKGTLAGAFDRPAFGFEPVEVEPLLWGMAMNTEDSLREYLKLFARLPPIIARLGPLARTFDFVADAAPGVKEILAVGKLCYEVREQSYDLVVVDAEAAGHIVGEISAPSAINELVHVGLVREQTAWMLDILEDPATTGVVVVTTPEEMPVNESAELIGRLTTQTGVDIAAVVANRVLPELFDPREEAVFDALCQAEPGRLLADAAGPRVSDVLDAARLAVARRRLGTGHLARLTEQLPGGLPMLTVPELFARSTGRRAVQQVAEALSAQLDGDEG